MTVRYVDGKHIIDFWFKHAKGRRQRIREVSPVQTKRGAEDYERQRRNELLNPAPKEKAPAPNFKSFVDGVPGEPGWRATYPGAVGCRHTTTVAIDGHIKLYLMPAFGKLALDEIDHQAISTLFAKMSRDGLSAKTKKNVRATLRSILASAVEWGKLPTLPKIPKIKTADPEWDHYTTEEVSLLIGAARSADEKALLLFACCTGARAGEQRSLQWGDIDFHRKQVIFRRSLSLGKTGPTKSGHNRKVLLTDELIATLKAIRHLKSDLVFCRADGAPLSIWQLHEHLEWCARKAGLRLVRWHDLRHSFASNLAGGGTPLRQIQEWLGHSTVAMTMRYSHLAPDGGREHIQSLVTATPAAPVTKNAMGDQ